MEACSEVTTEDDMTEGDLGDGMGARPRMHHDHPSPKMTREKLWNLMSYPIKGESERFSGHFSWTSCKAMYAVFRKEMDDEKAARWEERHSESSSEETSEELQRRLQEVTEKSEERNKTLEKEVNALQWEITFNQVQFKNVENSWGIKVLAENEALKKELEEKIKENHQQRKENGSLNQKSLELFSMLSPKERMDFQRTQPCCSLNLDSSALELAVYGACQCISNGDEHCPCARSAAASRKQVLQLKQELEQQQKRKEEAFVMMDAFRIAFEQQLRRVTENVLRQAESERAHTHYQGQKKVRPWPLSVGEKLKRILPTMSDGKIPTDSTEKLQMLLELLNDKEEALAHQRKVSYMLARITEDLEKRLQVQLEDLGLSQKDRRAEIEAVNQSVDQLRRRPPDLTKAINKDI
ncbi:hypothetical protein DNTS_026616 [Danionella cerebrum]|uniref:Coiled-coil domain-containing protein 125 n=1 Tax=Danionella cerebrum TaxID=2873325 RepID=A0A553NKG4_9TELE|nr:hypothetical protein DNTS_026616 [Danionella translucida]